MTLIKSISGIRGTIGNKAGENLTPIDIVNFTAAFGAWVLQQDVPRKIVVGRDGRMSGKMVSSLVENTLIGLGIDVIALGQSTTPTVEMAVTDLNAGAGIILTASHNPKQWNALKLLNHKGEFISAEDGKAFMALLESGDISFAEVDDLGKLIKRGSYIVQHIEHILKHPLVDMEAIKARKLKVVVDCINSTGAISVPPLLEALGCECIAINDKITGDFAHNPEPLAQHLTELSATVVKEGADLGISIDPDVDRLAFVAEDGNMFGEEYTLVAVADYILSHTKGNTVSNLSSSRALRDITEKHGGQYFAAAVGEVNVVAKMKEVNAIIGGEGNGGIIVPELHYGRDALAGIALFLTHFVQKDMTMSALRASYPHYEMVKDKVALSPDIDVDAILVRLHQHFAHEDCNTIDGLKINFANNWVHLRKSNTEPIIRIYAEAATQEEALQLVDMIKKEALK